MLGRVGDIREPSGTESRVGWRSSLIGEQRFLRTRRINHRLIRVTKKAGTQFDPDHVI
jgi:hypothetical protein